MKPYFAIGVLLLCRISAAGVAQAPDAAILAKGKTAFEQTCQTCHGDKGDGMGPTGKYLNPKPRNLAHAKEYKKGHTADAIFKTMTDGLAGTGMAPYGYLPEADRKAIAQYIVATFQKKDAGAEKPSQKKKK